MDKIKLILIISLIASIAVIISFVIYLNYGEPVISSGQYGAVETPQQQDLQKVYCSPDSRGAEFCITLYDPVCGWFSQNIKCLKYPCAQTYSNSCFACSDEKVEYYTPGECPK